MKDWTWQKWVGKFLLLGLSIVALIVDQLGVDIPLWAIIVPAVTQLAQWFLAWLPGVAWQRIVGKGLLLAVALTEIILAHFGLAEFELWLVAVPLISALAQLIISKAPAEEVPQDVAA